MGLDVYMRNSRTIHMLKACNGCKASNETFKACYVHEPIKLGDNIQIQMHGTEPYISKLILSPFQTCKQRDTRNAR
jgi:hypothetical protein